jgi:hypothetical protein
VRRLVAELAQQVAGDVLERRDVSGRHLRPPVSNSLRRPLQETLLVGLLRDVDAARIVRQRGLVFEPGECTDGAEHGFDVGDELFVAHFEIAGADTAAEAPRGGDFGAPLGSEVGRRAGMHPRLGDDPARHREERERRIPAVADQVDEPSVGKEPVEQAQVLHVHGRLVAPARLAMLRGVHGVHGADRGADRHPVAELSAHLVEWNPPVGERVQPAEVVDEAVHPDAAQVAVCQLRDEVRLVGDGELRVPVEHDAQQRRARAPHTEDENRRAAGRQAG